VKWFSWHGDAYRALEVIEDLDSQLESVEGSSEEQRKLLKAVREFGNYITANQSFIPNYGDRSRHGETISTAFVESTVNHVVSKRMVKKQQMRWSERGAHHLLQFRTQVLNEDLRKTFCRWYPGMQIPSSGRAEGCSVAHVLEHSRITSMTLRIILSFLPLHSFRASQHGIEAHVKTAIGLSWPAEL
jgi:hypothetical protein